MYGIEVSQDGTDVATVPLSGEFDLSRLRELKAALDVTGTETETVVDLSEVTFMDLESVRELAFRCGQAPNSMRLVNLSWQVVASVAASGLGEWLRFDDSEPHPALFSNAS